MAEEKRPPFLKEFRVDDNCELVSDILSLAKAMRADPKIWSIFERVQDSLDMTEDEMASVGKFHVDYFLGLSKRRPIDAGVSSVLLRQLAAGKWNSLECDEAVNYLKEHCHFN